ncbi:hydantoinase B/oxoprolinase family protein [Serratia odorifera]|jgi:N-methylhydantoinase B|uniref:Hydantoinase B/oxoprolinase n=1 Tax=Serratia odorifera DSM 4582 TaxID=667129 RepID=D4E6I4_SEROD|nr:hydantoinase B/oxoprolinase family protein [Serratia odorifera]EFE94550.1 hydantoinase B/oxoprolinase [Serratia odorifera DSM 4582]MBJ2064936.1 hydantoinase B/oxoprolinase family protein [Serratia odorifera]PNK89402.1 hydantoin utilization protein B [Serratia odorifera]RII70353.1 hydantoinase B/oxoprolinase family protein [Serratia odorifera]HEJ9093629.1 hydantoinase B/oxoprolinase family protein [Serratia odorifera]
MAIDGRNLQILANYCAAAADAMAFTLMRTAHSTFVKETEDFSCQIVSRSGLAFASPRSFGAPWYSGIDYGPVLALIDDYQPGDICITNDAYAGNVATHSPDIHIWKPVFHQGEIACFVVGHIHNTDVGGAVPASLSRSLTEIVQEGLRLPPLKIVSGGKLNQEVARIMRLNVRAPEQNWGDFKAQLASVNIGESKIHQIIARFGIDDFLLGVEELLDYAERQARAVIATIPDGDYFYADYADEDGEGGYPCRIAVTLKVKGDALELDYSGSDPQLASSLNMPTGGRERHPLALVGVTYVLATLDNQLLLNAGTLRATRAILPPGTIMNCEAPAAVGMRSLTCAMAQIATLGAFSLAMPQRLPANSPGGNSIVNIRTVDSQNRTVVASLGPVGGGSGGTPRHDGPEGSGGLSAFLKNTPIEISEAEVPVRFLRYRLAPDSAGAGEFRGGLATEMAFEVFAPNTVITARNRNRSVFASAGAAGGQAGSTSWFRTTTPAGQITEHGNTDVIHCGPGDVVSLKGPGAGGYGPAKQRQPAAVLRDVICGFVSERAARQQYGVVIEQGEIDLPATARLRATMADAGRQHFDVGPARRAFEALWTPARYQLLTTFLADMPVVWRHFLKHQVFAAVQAGECADLPLPVQMETIFGRVLQRFPSLAQRSAAS